MIPNLVKKTFITKDANGCEFVAILYRTRLGLDMDSLGKRRLSYRTEDVYVADFGHMPENGEVSAPTLKELQAKVAAL